jgi:hypothetical protein
MGLPDRRTPTEALLLQNAYSSGGFRRAHSVGDLVVLVAIYLGTAILWPVFITALMLQIFGVLPTMS